MDPHGSERDAISTDIESPYRISYDIEKLDAIAISAQKENRPVSLCVPESSSLVDQHSRALAIVRILMTPYQVLFLVVVGVNMSVLIVFACMRDDGHNAEQSLNAVAANIFLAVVIRQEVFLNVLFNIFTAAPRHWPFVIRKHLANIHHFGGVHSGCAISAVAWYMEYTYYATLRVRALEPKHREIHILDISACCAVLALLLATIITAQPSIRRRFHNLFEHVHRFAGWLTLAALWLHITCTFILSPKAKLINSAAFYLLILTTPLFVIQWLRIRKVPITVISKTSHEIHLSYPYKNMPPTMTQRFSTNPLLEWHGFATIPGPKDAQGNTDTVRLGIAAAGDWTKKLIENPPQYLWIRDPPTSNFLKGVKMFDRVLFIATGAGIAPMLSVLKTLAQNEPSAEAVPRDLGVVDVEKAQARRIVRVLWSTRDPLGEENEETVRCIQAVDPQAELFDTRTGRPDLVEEGKRVVSECGIEAVFVVSSRPTTKMIVNSVRRGTWGSGVAAYGAIFDS
ncbi:hypothetical protein M011DRAFT_458629 [Sporormia fimetaria CBS 119925]|uniref:FAD-binding FR-type domain-containing protein n=1 Tax=Sporormia fimetaria CBS 119925 TaxID=1340428 RepID=A0A6A6V9R5_9PLEO|nr:hypothetical protein M011DRAFT_458629 [Sporormia fimetaria CBS 119925]